MTTAEPGAAQAITLLHEAWKLWKEREGPLGDARAMAPIGPAGRMVRR